MRLQPAVSPRTYGALEARLRKNGLERAARRVQELIDMSDDPRAARRINNGTEPDRVLRALRKGS